MTDDAKPLDRNLYVVQLTSLRGIACMVVLIGHVIQVINYRYPPAGPLVDGLRKVMLGTFNAEGAVLVFFVLSGCVLSLSLRNVRRFDFPTLLAFYVKRVFRLYPLLWLSLVFAVFSMIACARVARLGIFSDWLGGNLLSGTSARQTLLSLSGLYTRYNGPMWSLRVELGASLLFPAIFLLVRNQRSRGVALVGLTILLLLPLDHRLGTSFGLSFAVGALIPMLPYRASRADIPLLLIAAAALVYDRVALAAWAPPERIFDLIETASAFVVVRDIYTAGQRYRFLLASPVVTLGEISFSVYLLHLPIFLMLFVLASHAVGLQPILEHPAISQIAMSALTAAVTVGFSIFTYRLVELPMHNLGRRLAKRISRRRPSSGAERLRATAATEPPLA